MNVLKNILMGVVLVFFVSMSFFSWLLGGDVVTPFFYGVGLAGVWIFYKETFKNRKQCPFCAERIKLAAVKCKHCGSDIPNQPAEDGGSFEAGVAGEHNTPDAYDFLKPKTDEAAKGGH